eukprot:4382665-Lingulodinium_polyedra.AAC.1
MSRPSSDRCTASTICSASGASNSAASAAPTTSAMEGMLPAEGASCPAPVEPGPSAAPPDQAALAAH